MNLRTVDLNLLVVLDALLSERHVTRAAVRVGLSQPAMSNALARLRTAFRDELLVRTPSGMEPTARARELERDLRPLLRRVERMLESEEAFDPATCERTFVLRMSDLLGRLMLPRVIAAFHAAAPGAAIDVVHLPPAATVEALETDRCDLAVSMRLDHTGSIRHEPVMTDRMVCVMRCGHPAAALPMTLDAFLALDHLRVTISPADSRFVDDVLARMGRRRAVVLNLPHWLVVPEVIRGSDLVAVMPERFATLFAGGAGQREGSPDGGLVLRELPFASGVFDWSLYWHRRHDASRAHAWLRGLIAGVARDAA